jgi:hypothetical protein
VDAVWSCQVGQFKSPDAFPDLRDMTQAFRLINQLASSDVWIWTPDRQCTTHIHCGACQQEPCHQSCSNLHRKRPSLDPLFRRINACGCHSIRKTDQFPVHQPESSTSVETLHFENMIQCESQSANQSRQSVASMEQWLNTVKRAGAVTPSLGRVSIWNRRRDQSSSLRILDSDFHPPHIA